MADDPTAVAERRCGVTLVYSIRGSEHSKQTFPATVPAVMGLPPGCLPTRNAPGEYKYSGMHDAGPLVPPIEGGVIASLMGAVQSAREYNDTYLTSVIEAEKLSSPQPKRAKTDDAS